MMPTTSCAVPKRDSDYLSVPRPEGRGYHLSRLRRSGDGCSSARMPPTAWDVTWRRVPRVSRVSRPGPAAPGSRPSPSTPIRFSSVDILLMPPLKGLKCEDRAYPALRLPSSPKSGEPGTPLRAGLSCRRPAMRDSIARTPHLSADPAPLVSARMSKELPLFPFAGRHSPRSTDARISRSSASRFIVVGLPVERAFGYERAIAVLYFRN